MWHKQCATVLNSTNDRFRLFLLDEEGIEGGGDTRKGAANLWERASISSLKQTDRMLLLLLVLLLQPIPVSVQFEQQASNVAAAAVALCLRFPFQFAVALASLI